MIAGLWACLAFVAMNFQWWDAIFPRHIHFEFSCKYFQKFVINFENEFNLVQSMVRFLPIYVLMLAIPQTMFPSIWLDLSKFFSNLLLEYGPKVLVWILAER